jgi:hypothetical protein
MALKRKNIDLFLNLFLTAALLNVLIQSNGSSSNLLWRKVMGLKIGSDGAVTHESL